MDMRVYEIVQDFVDSAIHLTAKLLGRLVSFI